MHTRLDDLPGVCDTARQIAEGRLTAETATRRCFEIIRAQEPRVQAWVTQDEIGALDAARRLDKGPVKGLLHGVLVGVKDIFAVRGLPWRCGSPIWADRVADFDAGSVALLRAAGAVILGKTETTEFAGYTPSRTRNPWDGARTPGGSSSGSAAAVACGMVPLAFGTQTSGSIVRPASYCGVVGYKPSFDLVETGGVAPLSRSLDTVGLFARSVRDVAYATQALTGLDLVPDADMRFDRLPVCHTPAWDQAEPELVAAWSAFEAALGHRLAAQSFAPEVAARIETASALHTRIMATEAAEALAHEYARAPELLSPALRGQLEEGRAMTPQQRLDDRSAMRALRNCFESLVPQSDVWLTPSATGPAPAFESGTGSPAFNRVWSLLGLPCCSIPILRTPTGLPIGVQVVGAMGNDLGVLTVADRLMTEFGTA